MPRHGHGVGSLAVHSSQIMNCTRFGYSVCRQWKWLCVRTWYGDFSFTTRLPYLFTRMVLSPYGKNTCASGRTTKPSWAAASSSEAW